MQMLEFGQEKYNQAFMVWGRLSLKSLVPPAAPVIVEDLKVDWRRLGNQLGRRVNEAM